MPSGFGAAARNIGKKPFLFSLLPMLKFLAPTLPAKNPKLSQDTILTGPVPDPQARIIRFSLGRSIRFTSPRLNPGRNKPQGKFLVRKQQANQVTVPT